MTPRRITAVICLAAAVLLIAGAFSRRWLVADVRSPEMNVSLRIGLTSLTACMATAELAACQKVEWSEIHGMKNVRVEGSSWMWLGRITWVVSILAAIGALGLGAACVLDRTLGSTRPLTYLSLALLAFMAGYYVLVPDGLSAIAAGRGFLLAGVGAALAIVAAFREASDRLD